MEQRLIELFKENNFEELEKEYKEIEAKLNKLKIKKYLLWFNRIFYPVLGIILGILAYILLYCI